MMVLMGLLMACGSQDTVEPIDYYFTATLDTTKVAYHVKQNTVLQQGKKTEETSFGFYSCFEDGILLTSSERFEIEVGASAKTDGDLLRLDQVDYLFRETKLDFAQVSMNTKVESCERLVQMGIRLTVRDKENDTFYSTAFAPQSVDSTYFFVNDFYKEIDLSNEKVGVDIHSAYYVLKSTFACRLYKEGDPSQWIDLKEGRLFLPIGAISINSTQ
ncbi:hypothetical protein GCM10023331_17190 [Algivirga pacifica]|uniref:Uncharacterized protein n=2 Tax=Algivirga pacifica TaxID=1162670 RepID=A0ABP9D8R3_9BACT